MPANHSCVNQPVHEKSTSIYYHSTLDLLWKIWLNAYESIQFLFNKVSSWHYKLRQYLQWILHLSYQDKILPSFNAPCLCSVFKLLLTQREVSSFTDCSKKQMSMKELLNLVLHDIMLNRTQQMLLNHPISAKISRYSLHYSPRFKYLKLFV